MITYRDEAQITAAQAIDLYIRSNHGRYRNKLTFMISL
jgi:hypothetical protein